MLGRASVPVLPFRSRSGIAAGVAAGAVVSVYRPLPSGAASVSPEGVVDSSAVLAQIFSDQYGITRLANPITLDAFGTPADQSWTGSERTMMTFFAEVDTYHMRVVPPGGRPFGIPNIPCRYDGPEPVTYPFIGNTASDSSTRFISDLGRIDVSTSGSVVYMSSSAGIAAIDLNAAHDAGAGTDPAYAWMFNTIAAGSGSVDLFSYDGTADTAAGRPLRYALGRVHVIDVNVIPNAASGAAPTNKVGGVGWGAAPGGNAIPASPSVPIALVQYRVDTGAWELVCAKGNSTAKATVALTGAPTAVIDYSYPVRIRYVPGVYVSASINGIEYGRNTDTSKMPLITGSPHGCFLFALAGTGTNEDMATTFTVPVHKVYRQYV